ncbi:MAG: TatD family hydrolase [Patescibacteria group bacterium]|nr:TatD family hydrolase [Patescibacteria group bacterium]
MSPDFFDVHTHLNFSAYEKDLSEVLARCRKNKIWLVNVGSQKDTSLKAIEIANAKEGIFASIGLHPIHSFESFHDKNEISGDKGFASRGEKFDYDFYKNLAQNPTVVAIGECGLDYYHLPNESLKELEKETLISQIELAAEVKKPLMIHCRNSQNQNDAFYDLISILNSKSSILNSPPGIIHFFSGNLEDAKNLLGLGFYFSFGGAVTYASRKTGKSGYEETLKFLPIDRILSETDAPYVAPVPYRGQRNEPLFMIESIKKIAEIKNIDFEKLKIQLVKNAFDVFQLNN